jgi:NAD(P)-dependent dehydrogenase (short-subunit alcohol dehydrogenase family)
MTQRLLDVSPEDYDFVMDCNLRGAFFVAQETAKRMVARAKGDPRKQHRIINIASVAGLRVLPQIGVYCMSKAGVVQMTKAMAVEWGKYGINTNAICPGYIETEINEDYFASEQGKRLIDMLPRKRAGKPEDLDGLLLLLAGDEAHFINGAIISADDGMMAG